MKSLKSKLIALFGTVTLVAAGITAALFLTSPTGFLSIDVNPSVEFSFNRLNRVVEAKGINPEAVALLDGKDFKGVELDDAVREVVFTLLDNGYLSQEEAMLMFSSDDRQASTETMQRIKNEAVVWLKEYYDKTNLVSQSFKLNKDEIKLAHGLGMSAGKYNLVKAILSENSGITTNELMNMSISELIRYAKTNNIMLQSFGDELFDDFDDDNKVVELSSYIGAESAKQIAFSHAGIDASSVYDLEVELDRDDGRIIYEVEFKSGDFEYEYDIDAINGAILKWEKDFDDDKKNTATSNYIGSERAKQIAFGHAGIDASSVYDLEVELDRDDGRMTYEVEFKAGDYEYEYDIDAVSGAILNWEKDFDDDRNDDKNDDWDDDRNDDQDDDKYDDWDDDDDDEDDDDDDYDDDDDDDDD